jgi:hypothetical protein
MSTYCELHGAFIGSTRASPVQSSHMHRFVASRSYSHLSHPNMATLLRSAAAQGRHHACLGAWGRCACRAASSTTEATQTAGLPPVQPQDPKPAQKYAPSLKAPHLSSKSVLKSVACNDRLHGCSMHERDRLIWLLLTVRAYRHSADCTVQEESAVWGAAYRHTAPGQLPGCHQELGQNAGAVW